MKYLFVITIAIVGLWACNTAKNSSDYDDTINTKKAEKVIVFKKGGCFGRCPIYQLTLYTDGTAQYDGERFTDRLGVHTKKLPSTTIDALLGDCKAANFFELPDKYESRIPDLASSTLTYMEGEQSKTIFWREQADDALKAIGKKIEAIANTKENWEINERQVLPVGAIANEFIVNLHQDVDAQAFAASYSDYGLTVVERLNPRGNYWRLQYDKDSLPPYRMLNQLNNDERIINVEFNKQVTQRN